LGNSSRVLIITFRLKEEEYTSDGFCMMICMHIPLAKYFFHCTLFTANVDQVLFCSRFIGTQRDRVYLQHYGVCYSALKYQFSTNSNRRATLT